MSRRSKVKDKQKRQSSTVCLNEGRRFQSIARGLFDSCYSTNDLLDLIFCMARRIPVEELKVISHGVVHPVLDSAPSYVKATCNVSMERVPEPEKSTESE